MRQLVFLMTLLASIGSARGGDTIPSFNYESDLKRPVALGQMADFLVDTHNVLTIEKILGDSSIWFRPNAQRLPGTPGIGKTVWRRFRLTNSSAETRYDYISHYRYSDTVWMYVVDDGRVTERWVTGGALLPSDKFSNDLFSDVMTSVRPGESRDYYVKMTHTLCEFCVTYAMRNPELYPGKRYAEIRQQDSVRYSLYTGMMLLIGLVSLFMYFVFREIIFIYFSSMMVCMAIYFSAQNNQLGDFVNVTTIVGTGLVYPLALAGFITSFYLFLGRYLKLPEHFPRVHLAYSALTMGIVGLGVWKAVNKILSRGDDQLIYIIWILVTLCLIIYLATQGKKPARVMLLSILALALGGLAHILRSYQVIPYYGFIDHAFQGGTLAFSGIIFYSLFTKVNIIRREKSDAEELERVKSRFFTNLSHEFRTPLTLMLGPLQQAGEMSMDPKQAELIEMARRNANRQLNLVGRLLDLSKAESGQLKLFAARHDFVAFLRGTVNAYASLAEQKKISLTIEVPEETMECWFDREKMEQVVYNLLTNAFKYTPSGGKISVRLTKNNATLSAIIKDSGIGIEKERLPYIFDRYYRAEAVENSTYDGYGIGLALVKELVELHQGKIHLESEEGKGTRVTLELPLGNAHLTADQTIESEQPATITAPNFESLALNDPLQKEDATARSEDKNTILLIEDNADVRAFIRQRLDDKYIVMEAMNGALGIRKAIEQVPDLIISDVMMPVKNGYEVCRQLKSDVRTSHIPVILLTAKAAREEKLEGLETGADDYLTKPFDGPELDLRIANLIRIREQLRQRFATEISLQPTEIATNSLDQAFLAGVLATVEAQLDNQQFGVVDLAKAVSMSTSNLNRKLKALVNQTANQFIQSVRLQRAKDLLSQGGGTVAEIADQTGFGSSAYFIRLFKAKYGRTPGQFLKNDQAE